MKIRFGTSRVMLAAAGLITSSLLLGGSGCSSEEEASADADAACLSNRAFFAQKVWGPVIQTTCLNCHSPDGVAVEEGAELQLLPPGYPGFLDTNMAALAEMAKLESDGKSVVLRKPLGELSHGGGVQLSADSKEYKALAELIERFRTAESCAEEPQVASFPGVQQLGELGTFRKASLQLTGKLPSAEEMDTLREGGLAALPGAIDELLETPEFLDWLKEMYNDVFLTDRYLAYNGYALNILNAQQFPYARDVYDNYSDEDRARISRAVAREPLELIAYIVKNNLPYSEILTADYTMMNPFSAQVYNASVQFDDPTDETEFKPGRVQVQLESGLTPYPQAGLITSPMWLNRYPTTPTNRNRHRARMVMDHFLATDILAVVDRPIDAEETAKYQNPTRDDPTCNGCHRQMDPIAGAFQKFDPNDQERLRPEANWHPEMFPPGYGREVMQTSDFGNAPAWLAQRLVRDPRFVYSAVRTVFTALTGFKPMSYPTDTDSDSFAQQLAAWEAQDATFRSLADDFEESGRNLKVLIRGIIMSPYYRAQAAPGLDDSQAVQMQELGRARLETPESLQRKISAVVGTPWSRSWDSRGWLTSDYRILYGGIDSDTITQRLPAPNGVMANIVWRMANEVACAATAYDFSLEGSDRALFPYVTMDHVPETATGDGVPGSVQTIRKNIQYLHARILGEDLPLDHEEISATYQLFLETWREGTGKLAREEESNGLKWSCRVRTNRETGEELPREQRIENDPNYTVRAWMAVITYLLSDYRFLHD
ncbi:MAG: DUF1588 domain-containing protein [Polyangiaceae bacterium]|nr:DUF1588 domain-containing protein [Polyangiaceae bacterium]MCW5789616.1 DUF1588 domain-containing protein [Polyangiaceae bacterium]